MRVRPGAVWNIWRFLWRRAARQDGEEIEQERGNENIGDDHEGGFGQFFFALYFLDDGLALLLGQLLPFFGIEWHGGFLSLMGNNARHIKRASATRHG